MEVKRCDKKSPYCESVGLFSGGKGWCELLLFIGSDAMGCVASGELDGGLH